MKILVTGGAGFVGKTLVPQLIDQGHDVKVIDDLSNPQSIPPENCHFIEGDVSSRELAKYFEEIDLCIALASKKGAIGYVAKNPTEILKGNADIYSGTFSSCEIYQVPKMIFFSSSMVFSESDNYPTYEADLDKIPSPKSVFGRSKLLGEWYCREFQKAYGLKYTVVRPSNIYGPNELPGNEVGDSHVIPELISKIQSGQYPLELLGSGEQTRCFIHVKDLSNAICQIIEKDYFENTSLNVGSEEEVSILTLAKVLWNLCERQEVFKTNHIQAFSDDVKKQRMDISKAKKVLSWKNQVSLEKGLKVVVEELTNKIGVSV